MYLGSRHSLQKLCFHQQFMPQLFKSTIMMLKFNLFVSKCVFSIHFVLVNGNWSLWSAFTNCSAVCGLKTQRRTRSCTNPPPAHGGLDCTGHSFEVRDCQKVKKCPGKIFFINQYQVMNTTFINQTF